VKTAVTGGIAEGKSTVLAILGELGYKTLSADIVAREVFLDPLVNALLAGIAGQSPPIEPAVLRQVLAGDASARHAVNRVMHPRITDRILRSDAEFIEIPLLIETCLQGSVDCVWVVTCGVKEQLRRLEVRYGNSAEGRLLLNTQLPTEAKIPFADEVLRTNGPLESVRRDISTALSRRSNIG